MILCPLPRICSDRVGDTADPGRQWGSCCKAQDCKVLKENISIFIFISLSKKKGKDQKSTQSSTTPDPGHHIKVTITQTNHIQDSQDVSPVPAGDHKATMNRQEYMTNTKQKTIFYGSTVAFARFAIF